MSKGRKAIPPAVKDNATYKDKGAIERQAELYPTGANAKLTPPKWLSEGAKKEWRRIVKLYRELDVPILNDLDKTALTAYVMEKEIVDKLYAEWKKQEYGVLRKDASETSTVEMTANNTPIKKKASSAQKQVVNPLLREIGRHSSILRGLAEQLALTPTGRAAIAVRNEKQRKSDAEKFMEEDGE